MDRYEIVDFFGLMYNIRRTCAFSSPLLNVAFLLCNIPKFLSLYNYFLYTLHFENIVDVSLTLT